MARTMRPLGTVLTCVAVLYGVDSFWFDGRYFDIANRIISSFYVHWGF
jgi:hypothetical protein